MAVSNQIIDQMVARQNWVLRVTDNSRIPGTSNFFSSGLYSGDAAPGLNLVLQKLQGYPYNKVWFLKGSGNLTGWVQGTVADVQTLLNRWIAAYGWCPPNAYVPDQPPNPCPYDQTPFQPSPPTPPFPPG